ncbi:MAG: DUF3040 domain-containing protein [Ruaniaceae bacterium]|nr:DUF3040 domain-containing protein [Ruaniaceae bacterium]
MPLSEYEQRVLAQMESQLRDADPKLARSLDSPSTIDLRRLSVGIGIGIVGLCVLVAGVAISQIWLGVLGFIAMLAGALYAMSRRNGTSSVKKKPSAPSNPSSTSSFMERQNERWDNREQ